MSRSDYDKCQNSLLAILYKEQCEPRLQSWLKQVDEFNNQHTSIALDQIRQANEEILRLIANGQRITRDLTPYLEAGIEVAIQANQHDSVDSRLVRLSQLREWNYNRWAINRVEQVEQSGGETLERLKSLAAIDESRLAPYAGQRFAEVWKKLFDACSKDDKFKATRMRILREYE